MAKNDDKKKKKSGLGTAAKVGAGIATAAGVGYLAHRAMKKGTLRLPGPSGSAKALPETPSFRRGAGSSSSNGKPIRMPGPSTPNNVDDVYGRGGRRSGGVRGHEGPVMALPAPSKSSKSAEAYDRRKGKVVNNSASQILASMVEYGTAAVEFASGEDKSGKKYKSYFNDRVKYASKGDRDRADRQADKNGRAGVKGGAIIGGTAGVGTGLLVASHGPKVAEAVRSGSKAAAGAAGKVAKKGAQAVKRGAEAAVTTAKRINWKAAGKRISGAFKKNLAANDLVTQLSSYADSAIEFASDDEQDKKKVAC